MDHANIPLGYRVQTQIPLDVKTYKTSEAVLADLGDNNNLAYTYYRGLVVYCAEEQTRWEWKEVDSDDPGLLPFNFVYPDNVNAFGIDYSNKVYNFFPAIIPPTVETAPLERIDEGNGEGIIIRGREPLFYGNVGFASVDLSWAGNSSLPYGATGNYSHAVGGYTTSSGFASNAEGMYTTASGDYSHTEGKYTTAEGNNSHAEGFGTLASGNTSHAEGYQTQASDFYSHAEGQNTTSSGQAGHAEGSYTIASGDASHAEGLETTASGDQSHAEGNGSTASGWISHAEGESSQAIGDHSHSEGFQTMANGNKSHAEGDNASADGEGSHAEGYYTIASGNYSHAEGEANQANGIASHAEGGGSGEGSGTVANGRSSHAEGVSTVANGDYSHAEGQQTIAEGLNSHSEGELTQATGDASHAEGSSTVAAGHGAHAEGSDAHAIGNFSHAGGVGNYARSLGEVSIGLHGTDAAGSATTVVSTDRLFNLGNGISYGVESNAFTILKNGLATLPSVTNALITAASGKAIVTKEYLATQIPSVADYKVYTAFINQVSTAAPTVTILGTNTLGTIVWTRTTTGVYLGTLTGAFTVNKSFHIASNIEGTSQYVKIKGTSPSINTFQISTHNITDVATDSLLSALLEIRVYN